MTSHPIRTGPFRFAEYRLGDQMLLERNPDYFLPGVPTVDRAIQRVIPEYTTAVAALESGVVDVVFDLPPEQVDKLKRSVVAHVDEVAAGRSYGFIWNYQMKPFDEPRIRRAFIKLIDKPASPKSRCSFEVTRLERSLTQRRRRVETFGKFRQRWRWASESGTAAIRPYAQAVPWR